MHHHVTLRGVAGSDVFRDDFDRRRFVAFAARYVREGGARCYAWALMENHVHLVLQTGRRPLQEVVHGFAFRYAQFFNWRHARPGHLFQNRYGSRRIEDDAYLLNAIAYVHLNPVKVGRARGVAGLADYRWTGHAGLVGARDDRLVDRIHVLSLFSEDVGEARRALVEWTESRLRLWETNEAWSWDDEERPPARSGEKVDAEGRLRAWSMEVEHARDEFEARLMRSQRLRRAGWTVDRVVAAVCARRGVPLRELLSLSRRGPVSDARALAAHLAMGDLVVSCAEVARRLDLSESATRRAAARGARIARDEAVTLGVAGLARA